MWICRLANSGTSPARWLTSTAPSCSAVAVTDDVMAGKAVIVRISATGRELGQNIWMVKQVLDAGAHGISSRRSRLRSRR